MHFYKKKKKVTATRLTHGFFPPPPQDNLRLNFFCDQNNGWINSTVWQGSEHFIKGKKGRKRINSLVIVLWLPGVTLKHSFSKGT